MWETEYAAGAGPHDFVVVETDRTAKRDASSRAKRFADPQNRAGISWILKTAENHHQSRFGVQYIFKSEPRWPHRRNDTLRVFGVLDCFEYLGRNWIHRLCEHLWHCHSRPNKHVDNLDAAPVGLFQEYRSFHGKQPVIRERSVPDRFPQLHQFPAVLADLHYR